jgi:hypothetical protein
MNCRSGSGRIVLLVTFIFIVTSCIVETTSYIFIETIDLEKIDVTELVGVRTQRSSLAPFASTEAMVEYLKGAIKFSTVRSFYPGQSSGVSCVVPNFFSGPPPEDFAGINDGSGPSSAYPGATDLSANEDSSAANTFSTTNIQEAGVDEADIIKTDGTYLYIAVKGNGKSAYATDPALDTGSTLPDTFYAENANMPRTQTRYESCKFPTSPPRLRMSQALGPVSTHSISMRCIL